MAPHPLLTPTQAAERLGLSVAELTDLIEAGKGPAYIKIRRTARAGMVRFIARDITEWAEELAWTCNGCHAGPADDCHPDCSTNPK